MKNDNFITQLAKCYMQRIKIFNVQPKDQRKTVGTYHEESYFCKSGRDISIMLFL